MIEKRDVFDALKKCSAYAPQLTPQPSEAVAEAWGEHLAQYPALTRDDLLNAVTRYYREPRDRMVQPADISKVARDLHKADADKWTPEEQAALEAKADSKAADDEDEPAIEEKAMDGHADDCDCPLCAEKKGLDGHADDCDYPACVEKAARAKDGDEEDKTIGDQDPEDPSKKVEDEEHPDDKKSRNRAESAVKRAERLLREKEEAAKAATADVPNEALSDERRQEIRRFAQVFTTVETGEPPHHVKALVERQRKSAPPTPMPDEDAMA